MYPRLEPCLLRGALQLHQVGRTVNSNGATDVAAFHVVRTSMRELDRRQLHYEAAQEAIHIDSILYAVLNSIHIGLWSEM